MDALQFQGIDSQVFQLLGLDPHGDSLDINDEDDVFWDSDEAIMPDDFLTPPLFLAVENGDLEATEKLLQQEEIDVNIATYATPLHMACHHGYKDIAKLLIEKGADLKARDKQGNTPLHKACNRGHWEVAKMLIGYGADLHAKDKHGSTPLHGACWERQIRVVKLLVDHGSDINTQDNDGMTPLHNACNIRGCLVVATCLIDMGADLYAEDNQGRTPFHIAINFDCLDAVQLLLSRGANPMQKATKIQSPLFLACENNRDDMVWCMLQQSPSLIISELLEESSQ